MNITTNIYKPVAEAVSLKSSGMLVAALLGMGLFAPMAQASVHEIKFDSEGRYQVQDTIAPGASIEVCGDFAKGEKIAWTYHAQQALDFNIHFHVGKKVNFPAKLDQKSEAKGELKTKLSQTYCWMWTNKNSEASTLELQLNRAHSAAK